MSLSDPSIEWHLLQDKDSEPSGFQIPEEPSTQQFLREPQAQHKPKLSHFYELLLTIALIYGVAVFWIWQRTEQHMAVLGDEVTALQKELEEVQSQTVEQLERDEKLSAKDAAQTAVHRFETDYLQFEVGEQSAEIVEPLLAVIDSKYRQFHQDLGVPLNLSADKLKIVVDLDTVPAEHSEHILVIASAKNAAQRYEIIESDALVNEVSMKLSGYILKKALHDRDIKPQWRDMVLGLSFYLQRENGYNRFWKQDEFYRQRRWLALNHPIASVYQNNYLPQSEDEDLTQFVSAEDIADPLIEYMLEKYEDAVIPILLDAFEQHSSWDTLLPDLFGISVEDFENNWHTYLKQNYPSVNLE